MRQRTRSCRSADAPPGGPTDRSWWVSRWWSLMAGGSVGCRVASSRDSGPTGSGQVATDTRAVAGFSAVDLRGVGQLTVTLGGTEGLTVEAEDNLLPLISSTVSGNTLVLELKEGRPTRPIVFRLAARQITALSTSGAGDIDAPDVTGASLRTNQSGAGNVRLERLSVQSLDSSLAGAGSLDANGTATRLTVNVAGAGNVAARDLAVREAGPEHERGGQSDRAGERYAQGAADWCGQRGISGEPAGG